MILAPPTSPVVEFDAMHCLIIKIKSFELKSEEIGKLLELETLREKEKEKEGERERESHTIKIH